MTNDVHDDLLGEGRKPAGTNADGHPSMTPEDYSDRFIDFDRRWGTTGGNAIIKVHGPHA